MGFNYDINIEIKNDKLDFTGKFNDHKNLFYVD